MPRRLLIASGLIVAMAAMSGCASAGSAMPTPTPVATPLGDKTLNIVDLLETAGDLSAFAPAQEAGTELAAREVNDAGGVLGGLVMMWHRADDLPATLTEAAGAAKADAAIVAANPTAATSLLEVATTAKVALLAIGTDKNIAEPTVKPYPDASAPAATASAKPTAKATTSASAQAPKPAESAASSAAARKAGAPAVPTAEFITRLRSSNPFLTEFTYGAESYQLVIALALAATVANDDAGPSLVRGLEQVTTGDVVCTDFAECLTVLKDNRAIKYIGPAGRMAYDARVGVVTFGP